MIDDRTHRDQKPIPTDPAERKARIRWVLNHRVWTYPVVRRMPSEADAEKDVLDELTGEDKTIYMGSLQECASFEFVYVNPETERIEGFQDDEDDLKNTAFRVWIETGPWYDLSTDASAKVPDEGWNDWNRWSSSSHDIRLDCGGPTAEDALLELASLVECFYNDDGTDRGEKWWCFWKDKEHCTKGEDGFCPACGFRYKEPKSED